MIHEQQPRQKGTLRLRKVTEFIIAWLLLAFCLALLLVGLLPPRVLFSPLFLVGLPASIGIIAFLLNRLSRRAEKGRNAGNPFDNVQKWSRNRKLAVLSATVVVFLLAVLARPIADIISNKNILERAKLHFEPITYGSVPTSRIDRTLTELEKVLDRLRKAHLYETPSYLIKVHLFSDVNEFIRQTGTPEWSAGGTLTLQGQPPELYIPVEQEISIWKDALPTTTPEHEITHVVTYEVLQLQSPEALPRFYAEGLANYESLKSFNRFAERWFSRLWLIFYRNQAMKLTTIPNLNIWDNNTDVKDVRLHYRLSNEFVAYLAHRYGDNAPWLVVQDIGQGMSFNDAFKRQFKDVYLSVYFDFLEYYYGFPHGFQGLPQTP